MDAEADAALYEATEDCIYFRDLIKEWELIFKDQQMTINNVITQLNAMSDWTGS